MYLFFSENKLHPFSIPNFLPVTLNGGWSLIRVNPEIINDIPGYGRGFIWRPPIRAGAIVVIVAGDIRGNATGGGIAMMVGPGTPFTNLTGNPLMGQCPPPNGTGLIYPTVREGYVELVPLVFHSVNTCPRSSRTGSFFNIGTAIGVVLTVVSALVVLAILFFVNRRRQRRINAPSTVTESKRGERLPWSSDRQPAFEPKTSPNPSATQVPLESGIGPTGPSLYRGYLIEPFPDKSTTDPGAPSTGKAEVVMQPPTNSGVHAGTGMRINVPKGPRSPTGTGKPVSTSSMCRSLTILYSSFC